MEHFAAIKIGSVWSGMVPHLWVKESITEQHIQHDSVFIKNYNVWLLHTFKKIYIMSGYGPRNYASSSGVILKGRRRRHCHLLFRKHRPSFMAQMVNDPPANVGTGFDPWVRKIPRRRSWQPTPVLWPGELHGQRSLADCSPWGPKELDMTERLTFSLSESTKYGWFNHFLSFCIFTCKTFQKCCLHFEDEKARLRF